MNFAGPDGPMRVHFDHKQEQSFVTAECDDITLASDHPVLLDYRHEWISVYLASAASSPETLLEDLAAEIAAVVGSWRSTTTYFNSNVDPLELLRSGSGLLLEAPRPISERLCATLESAAVRHTAIRARPAQWPMQALIAGPNFVVAKGFRVEGGPNNSFKGMPLRGTP